MPLLLIGGLTISTLGKVILGITVIRVHSRLSQEHSVDDAVVDEIHKEKGLGIAGIVLMVLGYFMEMVFYMGADFAAFGL